MTASTRFSSRYYPYYGRLHGTRGDGWAAKTGKSLTDWLQVDFGRTALVCAVATQGDINGNEWVIDFSLSFSSNEASWVYSEDSHGNKKASLYLFILTLWWCGLAITRELKQRNSTEMINFSTKIMLLPLYTTRKPYWRTTKVDFIKVNFYYHVTLCNYLPHGSLH